MTQSSDPKDQPASDYKGAVEQDRRDQNTNTSLRGQLPHRTQDPLIKSSDSDFPEPGSNPEHSGRTRFGSRLSEIPREWLREPPYQLGYNHLQSRLRGLRTAWR